MLLRAVLFWAMLLSLTTASVHGAATGGIDESAVTASSLLGAAGDSVRAVRIQSNGTIVLAANVSAGPVAEMAKGAAADKGMVIRLSADGAKVLSSLRVAAEVRDLAIDGQDQIYVAGGAAGAIKVDAAGAKVLWRKETGGICVRIDAASDGTCAALRYDKDHDSTPGAGMVYVIGPDGRDIGSFKGRHNTLDVAIDGTSKTIVTIGWRQDNAFDGKRKEPVQIAHLTGRGYDGTEKYHLYDWSKEPEAPGFINRPTNNMADTRGYRCAIGADGKVYAAFECAGGNHIFRYEPRLEGGQWVAAKGKKAAGDKYHNFSNSRSEHKTFVAKFDPATGAYLLGQEFTARLENGRANAVRVKDGAVAGGAGGELFLGGTSAFGLPPSFMPPGTGDYAGGGFVLAMKPGFDGRLFCVRVQANALVRAVDVRKIGDRTVIVCAGSTSAKEQDAFWAKNAIQSKAPAGSGFFVVLKGQ